MAVPYNVYKEIYDEFQQRHADDAEIMNIDNTMFTEPPSKEQFLSEIIKPDLSKDPRFANFLTKELKVSNIRRDDLALLLTFTDLAWQWHELGAPEFSEFLVLLRDGMLSGTSSVGGFERTKEVTSVNIHELKEEGKKNILNRLFRGGRE